MKTTGKCFFVVLSMLCKVVLTFESVDEILKFDHSNESYKMALTFVSVDEILKCDQLRSISRLWMKLERTFIYMKATDEYFLWRLLIMLYKLILTFESVDELLNCDF